MTVGLLALLSCAPADLAGFSRSVPLHDTANESLLAEQEPYVWLEDNWTETYAICQPPDPFMDAYSYVDGEPARFWQDECQEKLASDLGIDEVSFEGDVYQTAQGSLLQGMYHLLGSDLGEVDHLSRLWNPDDTYAIRAPFIEEMHVLAEVQGHEELRALLYNLVSSTVLETVYSPALSETDEGWSIGAAMGYDTRILYATDNTRGNAMEMAGLLVHETIHAWLDFRHVACPEGFAPYVIDLSGGKFCDPDWAGSRGFAVATLRLLYDSIPEEADEEERQYRQEQAQYALEYEAVHILEP